MLLGTSVYKSVRSYLFDANKRILAILPVAGQTNWVNRITMELCSVPSAIAMRPYGPFRGPPQQNCACTPIPVQHFMYLTFNLSFYL